MIYSYACPSGHVIEATFRIGEMPEKIECAEHGARCPRDFGSDVGSIFIGAVDPYRTFDLSCAKIRAEGEQQRRLDAPRDHFERRTLEKSFGRVYVGNDTSMFSANSRKGIEMFQERQKAGEFR